MSLQAFTYFCASRVQPVETIELIEQQQLAKQLLIGDVVFIRIPSFLFLQVSDTTQCWTNHVGVIVGFEQGEPLVAESRFPRSGVTTWSQFVARSEAGRVAVKRLPQALTSTQQQDLAQAVAQRSGVFYDTGFNLHSSRQFCSRFAREVMAQATGVVLGQIENFEALLHSNPQTNLLFWRVWYFGMIPWQRETVSPASLYHDPQLSALFDGKTH